MTRHGQVAQEMRNRGLSYTRIARELDITRQRAQQLAPTPPGGTPWTPERIKALRACIGEVEGLERPIVQEELAVRLGYRLFTINRWERGDGAPGFTAACALAQLEAVCAAAQVRGAGEDRIETSRGE